MNWKTTLLICLAILLGGGAVTTLIFSTEPTAQRTGATRETDMLVDVVTVERDTVRPTIEAMGTVEPTQDIVLRPRVSGEVIRRSEAFTPGGVVEEGEPLLRIDPADYENALQQRTSELQQAISDLKVARWRHNIAQREYQLREDTLSEENRALAVREPQLDAAQSQVESARTAVEQAQLDLERTSIEAPFDAHILTRNVNVGSQVTPGDELARLVGMDTYWVEATVPLSKLRWLEIPDDGGRGSAVQIHNRTAWAEGTSRTGYLYKLVGSLENRTRMARVLIAVPDPLARQDENADLPSLMVGAYVEAQVKGKRLHDVVRLNRDYIREDQTVWVMEDGTLRIRDVDIAVRDAKYAYVQQGLQEGDRVVTTNLSTVSDGAPLRLKGSESESLPDPAQE